MISIKNGFYALCLLSVFSCAKQKRVDTIAENGENTSQPIKLLVGTYTSGTSEGIYSLNFNEITGELKHPKLVAVTENPSFLVLSEDGKNVYSVNEIEEGSIIGFKWNEKKTELLVQDRVTSGGKNPCHITLRDELLAVANYSSGDIGVYQVESGRLTGEPQIRIHEGSSIKKPNQNGPHAHFSEISKDGRFIYVADLGIDEIVGYRINDNNELSEKFTALKMDEGDGPRHFVFHPSKNIIYIVSEFSNSVTAAEVDVVSGMLTKFDKKSTLPQGYANESYCADIHISSDGNFLYASNRGHDSLAIFEVTQNGVLNFKGTESVQGNWPRNFTLSPNEKFILVANQKSDNITVFLRDQKTGLLKFTENQFKMSKPVCLKF